MFKYFSMQPVFRINKFHYDLSPQYILSCTNKILMHIIHLLRIVLPFIHGFPFEKKTKRLLRR